MILYTGTGGYDLFNEYLERELGWGRIYTGKKVPRILGKRLKFIKSASGRYYRRLKIAS